MIYVVIIAEVAVLAFLGVTFFFLGWPMIVTGAPFLPSYRKNRRQVLNPLFEIAKKTQRNKFIDLGSGDGRVVIEFARAGFDSTGIEFNPVLAWWSRFKIKQSGLKNAKIIRSNFWKMDLAGFDIVYIYQLTSVNALLSEKFKKELTPGALIISAGFFLPNFELIKKEGIFWIYKN